MIIFCCYHITLAVADATEQILFVQQPQSFTFLFTVVLGVASIPPVPTQMSGPIPHPTLLHQLVHLFIARHSYGMALTVSTRTQPSRSPI